MEKALGKAAYFIEALKHIAEIKAHHMKIIYDGNEIEDNFILGLVSNSVSVAGYKAYSKMNIMMDDGKFEALFIKEIHNPLELQAALNGLMSKKFVPTECFSLAAVRLRSSVMMKYNGLWTEKMADFAKR